MDTLTDCDLDQLCFFDIPTASQNLPAQIKKRQTRRTRDYGKACEQLSLPLEALYNIIYEDNAIDEFDDEEGELYEWTDDDVVTLHEGILIRALRSINDRRCQLESRVESVSWIFSSELVANDEAVKTPFTFQSCCIALGLDPDILRNRVVLLLKQVDLWLYVSTVVSCESV